MENSRYLSPLLPMKWHQKLAFGLGHIFNDLCAAMWFSLLLIYFQYIVHFPDNIAGYLLLFGQVVDAISTPLIGYESDRIEGWRCLGKRKTWHLFGTVAVLVSFPFIFSRCINCTDSSSWYQFAYYAPFVAIFQIGWASVQIAHMALISQITDDPSEKTELSGIRNAGTLMSSIVIFSCGWVFFQQDTTSVWDDTDAWRFLILMFIVIVMGSLCSLIFHVVLKENRGDIYENHFVVNEGLSNQNTMFWNDWLKEPQFWLVAGMYMASRLIVNVSGTYWPLYVLNTLSMPKMYMVVIPLVVNVTGFVVSLLMRLVSDKIGRKMTLVIGIVFTLGGCFWLFFIHKTQLQVIGPSILIGAGGSILIVTSLAMTTDIIGVHKSSGAFVFGAMSFSDKLSNGLAVVFIQQFFPCAKLVSCAKEAGYYHLIMVYIIGGFACILLILLFITWSQRLGHLRKFSNGLSPSINDSSAIEDEDERDGQERQSLLNGVASTSGRSVTSKDITNNHDGDNAADYRTIPRSA